MWYIIITGGSLLWFILSLMADMLIVSAIVTPRWLIGSITPTYTMQTKLQSFGYEKDFDYNDKTNFLNHYRDQYETTTISDIEIIQRYPSVGIYTRCKVMQNMRFHCGRFDLDGFNTDANIYPTVWKVAMFFISFGFVLLTLTVLCTLISCCRQSIFGKSIHNMIACAQVVAGISVMLSLFLYPLGWSAQRVQQLCGPDVEPFYAANCSIGISFYCGIMGVLLCFISAGVSMKAESSNLRMNVKQRIEEGERLVCIP